MSAAFVQCYSSILRYIMSNKRIMKISSLNSYFDFTSLENFFSWENFVCYCSNINRFFEVLKSATYFNERWLFIVSSKETLKL